MIQFSIYYIFKDGFAKAQHQLNIDPYIYNMKKCGGVKKREREREPGLMYELEKGRKTKSSYNVVLKFTTTNYEC